MRRHTEPPQFLEEFTLGIFAFGLGKEPHPPAVWRWVGATRTLFLFLPLLQSVPEKLLFLRSHFPPALILSSDWFACCVCLRATFATLSLMALRKGFVSSLFGCLWKCPALQPLPTQTPVPAAGEGQPLWDLSLCFHPCSDGMGPEVSGSQLGAHSNEGN